MAKAFLETRGLKSKVAGEWIEHPEEYTMVLVSTQSKDPNSPIVLPGTCFAKEFPVIQAQPAATIYPEDPSSTEEDTRAAIHQAAGSKRSEKSQSTEIRTLEDFTRKHDPKIILPPSSSASQHEQQRGRLPIRLSDLRLKVNKDGKAEVRKKKTPKRRADSELRTSYPAGGGVRLIVLENGSVGVDKGTKPTPEVKNLLQTGIDASKRGNATSLTNRLQDSRTLAEQDVRPQRFSDMERRRLKIDWDRMPATTSQESAGGQSLAPNPKSTPPRPDWSPIETPNPTASLIANPGPSPTKLKLAKKANQSSVNSNSRSPSFRDTEIDLQKGLVERSKKSGYPTLPFPGSADALNTNPAKENLNPSTAASNQDDQASSILPVSQDDFTFDYDSGIGTSRGTSTEPAVAKRQKPGAKQPQQIGNHIVTQLNKKTGKAARGPYITRKKKAAKEIAAAAMSLGEANGAT
jgi:hypothetical protein